MSEGNALLAEGALSREGAQAVRAELREMDTVFAVLFPEAEDRLSAEEERCSTRARTRASAASSPRHVARKLLDQKGVPLEDTPKGTRWRRKH